MKILVSIRNPWFFRNVSGVIEELAERGHKVLLVTGEDRDNLSGAAAAIDDLLQRRPNVRIARRRPWKGAFKEVECAISLALDRLHFGGRRFDGKPVIKHRSVAKSTGPLLDFVSKPIFRNEFARRAAMHVFGRLSEATPPDAKFARYVSKAKYDVALICPLIDVGHSQFGELRAMRAAGGRVAAYVHSWDNLSSKSWLRDDLDAVIVWNEMQFREAREFHGIRTSKIIQCGASPYDTWFETKPQIEREQYLSELGLDPAQKTILYVGSALFRPPFGDHLEPDFVLPWIEQVRSSADPALRNANIIVRPHPKRRKGLEQEQFDAFEHVKLWPPVATNPVTFDKRLDYLHSLVHSDAVVGLNTSAFIESVLVGKPTLTVLDPRFEMSQRGTFHFDWLIGRAGAPAMVRAHDTIEEHLAELAKVMNGLAPLTDSERQAVQDFVRPRGADKRAVDLVCNALEKVAKRGRRPRARVHRALDRLLFDHVISRMAEQSSELARRQSMGAYKRQIGMITDEPPVLINSEVPDEIEAPELIEIAKIVEAPAEEVELTDTDLDSESPRPEVSSASP